MQHIYTGKTKDVYRLEDGNLLLKFKDDVTGENGKFDPGANHIALSIDGVGKVGVQLTKFFYEAIESAGIKTHLISADVQKAEMIVKPAKLFGKGIEVVCRVKADGSFVKRYGDFVEYGQDLDYFVETTLKDDNREDPPISYDALDLLGIVSKQDYFVIKVLIQEIAKVVQQLLRQKGIELHDIKMEFGKVDDQILLIDEISGGCMRAYKDGQYIQPLDLPSLLID